MIRVNKEVNDKVLVRFFSFPKPRGDPFRQERVEHRTRLCATRSPFAGEVGALSFRANQSAETTFPSAPPSMTAANCRSSRPTFYKRLLH